MSGEDVALDTLIRNSAKFLSESCVEDPMREARLLMAEASGLSIAEQLSKPERILKPYQIKKYFEFLAARKKRIPFAYITKKSIFYGREFYVENCLIPRPETELVVDLVKEKFKNWFIDQKLINQNENFNKSIQILDVCTGSGCLGLTIFLELQQDFALQNNLNLALTLTDISFDALKTCKKNLERFCLDDSQISILKTDLFPEKGAAEAGCYDLVIANPPYIRSADISKLAPEVAGYEPHLALDGGADGLDFYHRISNEIRPFFRKDSRTILLLEHGAGQREDIIEIFKQGDLNIEEIIVSDDWQGHDRILGFSLIN